MRRMLLLLSLVLVGQVCLSAQSESDVRFEKLEKETDKDNKVAIGIEGGWNENFFTTENTAMGNELIVYEGMPYENIRGSGRLGLTIMASASKKFDGLMSKYTYENSLGYIFANPVESGGGLYFHSGFNANFRLKGSNSYFYTGYGFGVEYYSSYQDIAVFLDIQFARLPLGFKFMLDSRTELFMEASLVLGLGTYGKYFERDTGYDDVFMSVGFSFNTDFKAGLRFWL